MDPFATLGIARSFEVDLAAAERKHLELSRALHPDRYVGAGPSERRAALSKAVEVNEAWRVVRDPIRRAEALFGLAGIAVGENKEPKPDPALLMEVLEQREALAEARVRRDVGAVQVLAGEVTRRAEGAEVALAQGFAHAGAEASKLRPLVVRLGELRFWRRFLEEVSAIEDEMANAEGARGVGE
jgi:molecular chaperone HscB